jgi:hypothetical protein
LSKWYACSVVRRVPAFEFRDYQPLTQESVLQATIPASRTPGQRPVGSEQLVPDDFAAVVHALLVILSRGTTGVCDVVLSQPIGAGNASIESALPLGRLVAAWILLHAAQLLVQPALRPQTPRSLHDASAQTASRSR